MMNAGAEKRKYITSGNAKVEMDNVKRSSHILGFPSSLLTLFGGEDRL
ncbi:MAG: hypothetical protein U0905_09150 [Pirellulales bacterium]